MTFKQIGICSKILKDSVVTKALNEAEARAFYQKKNLSPSIDFMCMTKGYFNLKFSGGSHLPVDPTDITYEGERAKAVGNAFHEYIQNQFDIAKVLRLNETTLEDTEHKIRARIDSVIEVDGELFLVELKSAKSYSMHLMGQDGSPDIEHQKQVQLYFHLLELNRDVPEIAAVLQGRTITRAIILYESKNDHKIMEFLVNKNEAAIKELLKYTRVLWKAFAEKKEPKYKFEPDSPECMYKCSKTYYEMCHGKPKPVKDPEDKGVWGFSNVKETKKDPSFR